MTTSTSNSSLSRARGLFLTAIVVCLQSPFKVESSTIEPLQINFSMEFVNSCERSADQGKCLKNVFGTNANFDIAKNKKVRSVEFLYVDKTPFVINGIEVRSRNHLKLLMNRLDDSGYQICNVSAPITVKKNRFKVLNCLCGFDKNGEFKRTMDSTFDFLPQFAVFEIGQIECRVDGKFRPSSVTLLKEAQICGANFATGTVFGEVDGFATLEPGADTLVQNSDGKNINLKEGLEYLNEHSASQKCNWRPARKPTK